jgi:hypothetical protein
MLMSVNGSALEPEPVPVPASPVRGGAAYQVVLAVTVAALDVSPVGSPAVGVAAEQAHRRSGSHPAALRARGDQAAVSGRGVVTKARCDDVPGEEIAWEVGRFMLTVPFGRRAHRVAAAEGEVAPSAAVPSFQQALDQDTFCDNGAASACFGTRSNADRLSKLPDVGRSVGSRR